MFSKWHVYRCSFGIGFGGKSAHGEPPLPILLMIFMTPRSQIVGVNVEIALIVMQDLPLTWTGSEQWDITYSVHVFLKTWVPNAHMRPSDWSINIIKPNTLRELESVCKHHSWVASAWVSIIFTYANNVTNFLCRKNNSILLCSRHLPWRYSCD